jgi:dTDP-4-dehydrorhamnose reductase
MWYTGASVKNSSVAAKTGRPRLLVTGGSGTLGSCVASLARASWDVTATYLDGDPGEPAVTWRRLDLRQASQVAKLLAEAEPDAVIHTAAIAAGPREELERVNVAGTRQVARAAASRGARLVHVSTDLVFDGRKGNYIEDDPPAPVTEYGRSKALAEKEVLAASGDAAVVRTSLIYSWRPKLDRHTRWLTERLASGEPVHLFTDELRSPVWVESLARALLELAAGHYAGLLHVAGSQSISRYDYGLRLLRFHGLNPSPVIAALGGESGLVRPLDTTLDSSRARQLLATPLPGVDEVLSAPLAPPARLP